MKFLLCLLILVPLVYSASIEERALLGDLFGGNSLVQQLLPLLSSASTHDGCVSLCESHLHQSHFLCDLECTAALALLSG